MKITSFILSLILCTTGMLSAQDWQWAGAFEGSNINNHGRHIHIDKDGNKYVSGLFGSSMDFDPGPGVYTLTAVSSSYQTFIVKLDSADHFIWAKTLESSASNEWNSIAGISSDPINGKEIYLTGHYKDGCDFDPGSGVSYHAVNGLYDMFIIKMDSAGNFIWGKSIGGQYAEIPYGLTLDFTGSPSFYITGGFGSTVDFDPGPGIVNLSSPGFDDDAFLLKLDTAGNFQWVNQIEGRATGRSVAVDTAGAGNVYLTGWFLGNTDFITGTSSYYLNSSTLSSDAFIVKYSNNGNFIWANGIGGSLSDEARQIKMSADGSGHFFIAGHFRGTVDFDPGTGTMNLMSQGNSDLFAARFDSSGALLWASGMGGSGSDYINSMDVKPSTDYSIFVAGEFANTADFDPGPGTYMMTSDGSTDSFVCKLDSLGNFVWAVKSSGGTSMDIGVAVAVAPTGNHPVYLTGEYKTSSLGFGNNMLSAPGGNYVYGFIAKLQDTTFTTALIEPVTSAGGDLILFPNPAINELKIKNSELKIERIEILDLMGQIQSPGINHRNNSIDVSELKSGLYILLATTNKGIITKKLIKK